MRMSWKSWCLILMIVFSCKEDPEPVTPVEQVTIAFDFQAKLEVKESQSGEIVIPIKLSKAQQEPVVIAYEAIGQEVVNGSDFTILSPNPLTIPTGSTQVSISLKVNDNSVVQPEERNIYFRIRTINKENIKIAVPKEVVIAITEDDCKAEIANVKFWLGKLKLQIENDISNGNGIENTKGLCSGILDVTGKFIGSQNPESTVSIKLTRDTKIPTKGTAVVDRAKLFTFSSQYEVQADGSYDELKKRITLNYSFFDLSNSANNFKSTMLIETE